MGIKIQILLKNKFHTTTKASHRSRVSTQEYDGITVELLKYAGMSTWKHLHKISKKKVYIRTVNEQKN